MTSKPTSPVPPEDGSPESYVGLDAERAEQLAGIRGWNVVRSLPPGSIITMEYLEGRINFEVDQGTVIRCWLG
ncbi:I78 family peptidase inhibitor [Streptomyces sp. NPDC093600]|uniref:I78 family peptidase inhibitor n=1 Tax=Streptomyces sp. NPDC093600 TaxID=3366047 RepID=UPI0037F3D8CC